MSSPSGVVIVCGVMVADVMTAGNLTLARDEAVAGSRGSRRLGRIFLDRLLIGVCFAGIGGTSGGGRHLRIACLGRQEQVLHMGYPLRQCIGDELQCWREPDADALAHSRPELALGGLQRRGRLSTFGLATEHGV